MIYYYAVAHDDRVLRTDGRVEDVGDFTDFYVQPANNLRATEKKSLQELQDEVRGRLVRQDEVMLIRGHVA